MNRPSTGDVSHRPICQQHVTTAAHNYGSAEDWREYIWAAERKLRIAYYPLDRLQGLPAKVPEPSIAEQAEFEGVLIAFVSAIEQAAGAIHVAGGGEGNAPALHKLKPSQTSALTATKQLKAWTEDPSSRTFETSGTSPHRYYKKARNAGAVDVQRSPRGSNYRGSRQLVPYCLAVVHHLHDLAPLLIALETELAGRAPHC